MLKQIVNMAWSVLLVMLFLTGQAEAGAFKHQGNGTGDISAIGGIACHGKDELDKQFMTG